MSFVNLHTHSHFSQMDSISKPKDIVERIKEMGQTSVALTDHGTTSGLIETYKICKKQGIHFVFGVEGYLVDDVLIKEGGYSHICLWAKNNTGYLNLKKLVSLSNEHKYKKPRMDIELITKYREGLVVSSACMGGWLNHPNGLLRLQQLMHLFPDDLYIELHTYTSDEQKELNVKLLEIAGKYSLPLLAACDAHYVRKSDAYVHKQWITQGKEREDGYYQVPDFYLHSEQEVYEALSYLPLQKVQEAIDNTQKLADSCNVEITFGEQHYPHVDVPDEKEAVLSICRKNWESKVPYKELRKAHNARVLQEIPVLEKAKYLSYFLIMHKILEHCEEQKIPVGFSRGSAGGCDVAYLMGIHRTDPIRFNLIFERFLHEERVTPCDIDVDTSQQRREEVIGFIKDTYGHDRVFQARTYGYMAAKGALKRAGNALGYEAEEIKQLSKQIPRLSEEEAEEFKGEAKEHELLEKIRNEDNGELIDLAKAFVGILQTYSVHASAVIVFDADPCNYCAIEKSGDNFVTGYEFHTLEDMGILKLDILGIKTADVVYGTLDLISEPPDLLTLPLDDKKTFDMLCEGKTAGVFQAESPGFTRLITGVQPRHFEQYAPLMAVYRPAIIDAGLLDSYINRSQGTEEVEYLHPDLEEILKSTNGVMLFQEQLLEVARKVCGYTLGQADMIRRACGRKLPEEMAKIGPDFISRAIANGYSEEVSKELWKFVEFFAGYGFGKAHSFGYGYMSFVTGYLKANYPKEFMVSLINSEAKQEDAVRYIHECKQMNIAILPPDLRHNKDKWVIEGEALRIPLCYLKYVGHIKYELADTFEQFMSINNINKRMLESLIKSGACDFFKLSRPRMLALVEPLKELKSRQEQCQEKIKENQELLDSSTEPKDIKKYTRQLESWRKKLEESKLKEVQSESFDEIEAEISVLGFSFKQVPKVKHGKLIKVYSKNDKNGNEMSWLTFETKYGEFRCTVFARQWKLWKSIVDQGNEYVFVVNNKGILEELRKELKAPSLSYGDESGSGRIAIIKHKER